MASASAKELKVREDWEEVLQSVETVLFDCDGKCISLHNVLA
jgi:hypothetical protein